MYLFLFLVCPLPFLCHPYGTVCLHIENWASSTSYVFASDMRPNTQTYLVIFRQLQFIYGISPNTRPNRKISPNVSFGAKINESRSYFRGNTVPPGRAKLPCFPENKTRSYINYSSKRRIRAQFPVSLILGETL